MNTLYSATPDVSPNRITAETGRLDYLDAARAFALLLGIVFHASLSFVPTFIGWAVQDVSTSPLILQFVTVSHSFRLEIFFLIAGFFGHRTLHRQGLREFVSNRSIRLIVPFTIGWFILRPLLISGWSMGAASLSGAYSVRSGLIEGLHTFRALPSGLFTQTHLWFLYYLAMISAVILMIRALLNVTGEVSVRIKSAADRGVTWIAGHPLGLIVCAVPTASVLWFMSVWGVDTPDLSLIPDVSVLAIYSGFFGFGWLLARQPDALANFSRLTATRAITASVTIAATLYLSRFQVDPGHPFFARAHIAFVVSYALMMWSLVAIILAGCRFVFRSPRPWVRYIADASYWLYLVHLPIVVWLQVALADTPLNWINKLSLIVLATLAIGLLSYDLLVRDSWIGVILNGRRRPRVLSAKKNITFEGKYVRNTA